MDKTIYKLTFRKIRRHLPQFLGMGLLVVVGTAFFVTLYTIYFSYKQNAESFFDAQKYADITFYGSFDRSDVEMISDQLGKDYVLGRNVHDYKNGAITLRAVSLTDGINTPFLYEGSYPESKDECLLLNKHAEARGIKTGDTLKVDGKTLRVSGIVASPEYVYLVQNERSLMAKGNLFGVIFVIGAFFDEPYNEIVAIGQISGSLDAASNVIEAEKTILQTDQLNYNLFLEDLDQIRTFAYVFPLVFALLIVMIIFVMLKRTVAKEQRQIGVYKALGQGGGKIVLIYASQAGLMAILGALLGCIVAMLICDTIIGLFSTMFEVPGLAYEFYPILWAATVLVAVTVCVLSALFSVRGILKPLPAELIQVRMPSGSKQLLLEKVAFLWNRLSFNSRYALKSTFRNKGRFFAVVMGMCGSCALLVFAFGFFDSAEYTQSTYFDDFARYDVLIEFEPIPLSAEHPVSKSLDEVNKALVLPIRIDESEYRLIVVEDNFDMQNIDTADLKNGVVIPAYYADKWNVDIGDKLRIGETDVKITGLSEQSYGLSLYMRYEYAKNVFPDYPPVYNVIFARDGNLAELDGLSQEYGFQYSTLADDKLSFSSVMETLNTLIWFMLGCAVILGLTVLYGVGLMNLSAREYEFMFMGVMGYPLKSIMLSHVKETVLQLVLAIPCGFVLGYGILSMVKSAFSGDNFVLSTAIFPQSYLFSGAMVAAMAGLMTFISARHISRLDIVEGLKARDE